MPLKPRCQAARRASWCGGAGASRSSSRETRIDCQTSQAATWLVARSAIETISFNLPHTRDGTASPKIGISGNYVLA